MKINVRNINKPATKYELTETILRAKEGNRLHSIFTKIGEYDSLEAAIAALDEHRFHNPYDGDYKTEIWTTAHDEIRVRSLKTIDQFMVGYDIFSGNDHSFGETWTWSPITEDDDEIWPRDISWADALDDTDD